MQPRFTFSALVAPATPAVALGNSFESHQLRIPSTPFYGIFAKWKS